MSFYILLSNAYPIPSLAQLWGEAQRSLLLGSDGKWSKMKSFSEILEACCLLSVKLTLNKWQRPRQCLINNPPFSSLIYTKHIGKVIMPTLFFPFSFLAILLKPHIAPPFRVFVFLPVHGHCLMGRARSHITCHLGCLLGCSAFQCDCISIHLLTEVAMLQTGIFVIETSKACGVIDLYAKPSQQN